VKDHDGRESEEIVITLIRRGRSESGKWHDGPEGCTLPVEECICDRD